MTKPLITTRDYSTQAPDPSHCPHCGEEYYLQPVLTGPYAWVRVGKPLFQQPRMIYVIDERKFSHWHCDICDKDFQEVTNEAST
jgi:hypothetical protein